MSKVGSEVFTVTLVTLLLFYSENCNSQSDDVPVPNHYKVRSTKVLHHNFPRHPLHNWHVIKSPPPVSHHYGLPPQRIRRRQRVQDNFKKLKHSRNTFYNTPKRHHNHLHRLIRQAYPGHRPTLYPSLPTQPSNYNNQPYPNNNYAQQEHTGFTPSYNPQWQHNIPNYSQPGYPGPTMNNGNGFNNPQNPYGYNPNYKPYDSRPSAPVGPNPADNPLFGHGHGHRYYYTPPSNISNFGPQNPSGYQPYPGSSNFNNHPVPGHSPYGNRNDSFKYNPSPRPPYQVNNSSISPNKPSYPPYTTQRYPAPSFNNATQGTPYKYPNQFGSYNNSLPGSYNNKPGPPNGSHGSYNPAPNYPNPSFPGFSSPNSTAAYPNTPQTGRYNNSNNNIQYPSHHNNFSNSFNRNPGQPNYPFGYNLTGVNSNTGYNGQNNFAYPYKPNQSPYPQPNGQLPEGTGYYPQPQYNGTSTYRIANHYNPSIPNQPPRRDNFGPNNSFYPSNVTPDPTRVAPERFSY